MSNGILILLVFLVIIIVPVICVFIIYKVNKHNRAQKNKRCICEVQGTIIRLKLKGGNGPFIVTVQYQAGGALYSVSETVKLKSSMIKAGPVPVGQRKTPVMGDIKEGTVVTVKYNPEDHREAIIKGNEGFVTG